MSFKSLASEITMESFYNKIRPTLKRRGYADVKVGWDDCTRAYGSALGSNISDWTFKLKDGTVLPFIRNPNFKDRTLTIPAKEIAIIVGNETVDGKLEPVTFQHYLENYGKYNPGVPNDVDLSMNTDELVTVRFIAVIVPEDENGTAEGVWTSYNYQTNDKKNPKNFIGASFHMGVGSHTDGPNCEPVYLVKTNSDGTQENTYFRLTNENLESKEQKESVASVLGTRSTGTGRNRVQCFQIPRKQHYVWDPEPEVKTRSIFRSMAKANVSYGSSAGRHVVDKNLTYERDKSQNITVTFATYMTISLSNDVNDSDIETLLDELDKNYQDTKALWDGSLVVNEGYGKSQGKDAPIKLPELTEQDYLAYNQKVTHFPKDIKLMSSFPE